jgi:hypothetical protein
MIPASFLVPLLVASGGTQSSSNAPSLSTPAQGGGPPRAAIGVVQLQPTTPGTAQVGHSNINGTSIAGSFKGDGSQITGLDAAKVTAGTLSDSRLSSNVATLGGAQSFSGAKSFSSAPSFNAAGAPFSVASSTKVANLNADTIDGLDSSAFLQSVPVPLSLSTTDSYSIPLMLNTTGYGSSCLFAHADQYYGIVVDSDSYPAVVGQSNQSSGVSGTSVNGMGVVGWSANQYGVWAHSSSPYAASYGECSSTGPGVEGYSTYGTGVVGSGGVHGVQGTASTNGYSGVRGVHTGQGFGVSGSASSYFSSGLYGNNLAGGYALVADGETYLNGNLWVTGSKGGFVSELVKNGDTCPLEVGDLVEIAGSEPSIVGDIPVIVVRRATSANAEAVLGPIAYAVAIDGRIAESAVDTERHDSTEAPPSEPRQVATSAPRTVAGAVAPGGYASVVTLGAFKAIKVDASYGAIRPGSRLVASPNPGFAAVAVNAEAGTIVGKALDTMLRGSGTIAVFVDQQ